jgi:hypothetical protein
MRGLLLLVPALAVSGCGFPKPAAKPLTQPTEKIDDRNTNYRPDGSTLGNAARAGKRMAQMHDFDQMKLFIFSYELENNRMPTIEQVKADLKNYPDASEILKKIEDGVIILTGTTDKNALWAYEIDAEKAGGIVCTGPSGAIKRATADEVKQLLGKK